MDLINIESEDDEDEDGFDGKVSAKKGKMPARVKAHGGLRPVRVEAHEHQDRVVSVNMESSSSKSAPAAQPEVQAQAQTPKGKENAFAENVTPKEPRIKEEPVDEDQVMADVPHTEEADDGPLPETPKVRKRFVDKEQPVEERSVQEPPLTDPTSLLRTAEEKEEHERHEHDLQEIKKLFAVDEKENPPEPPPQPEPEPSTETGDQPAEQEKPPEENETPKDKLAGHLFLMQFPPMTPNLLAPSVEDEPPVKPEPEPEPNAEGNRDTNTNANTDNDVQILNTDSTPAPPQILTASDWQLQAGRAGKLNVHASGRVTMDWGGIRFELDLATGVDFLQEAVVKSAGEQGQGGEDGQAQASEDENKVWSMGQLSGKFTVMPDWESML